MAREHATGFKTPTATDTALTEAVRRLVEAYSPERIYLFGSVARGDAGPDSDYDLMVVVPDDAPPERKDCDLAYRALRGLGIAKDLLVWTRSEFENRLHLKASLPSTIVREGKLLHAA
jgi:predicted nucleotidyltransferase